MRRTVSACLLEDVYSSWHPKIRADFHLFSSQMFNSISSCSGYSVDASHGIPVVDVGLTPLSGGQLDCSLKYSPQRLSLYCLSWNGSPLLWHRVSPIEVRRSPASLINPSSHWLLRELVSVPFFACLDPPIFTAFKAYRQFALNVTLSYSPSS